MASSACCRASPRLLQGEVSWLQGGQELQRQLYALPRLLQGDVSWLQGGEAPPWLLQHSTEQCREGVLLSTVLNSQQLSLSLLELATLGAGALLSLLLSVELESTSFSGVRSRGEFSAFCAL